MLIKKSDIKVFKTDSTKHPGVPQDEGFCQSHQSHLALTMY